jgi:transcription elongation factor Elf1
VGGGGDPEARPVHRHPPWKEPTMMTCPRCGNPAILMTSEEFQLLDCKFCDDVIDLSYQELPEPEPVPA